MCRRVRQVNKPNAKRVTKQDFIDFKDFILLKNTYFDRGFANAFVLPSSGRVVMEFGNELANVFPTDTEGDYFYLRLDNGVSFNRNDAKAATNCGTGRTGFDDIATVYLVASVKKADVWTLINNLRNTSMWFTGFNAYPTGVLTTTEEVIANELRGATEEEIKAALQRADSHTMVRLSLSVQKTYVANTCITDPCLNCN